MLEKNPALNGKIPAVYWLDILMIRGRGTVYFPLTVTYFKAAHAKITTDTAKYQPNKLTLRGQGTDNCRHLIYVPYASHPDSKC